MKSAIIASVEGQSRPSELGRSCQDRRVADSLAARERARCGDRDGAIAVMRNAVDELHQAGRLGSGVGCTGVLVETLLERGGDGDLAEAQEGIDWLANLTDDGWAIPEITLLRVRALLSKASGDESAYRDHRDLYREMAESLGFEGHIDWAEAMLEDGPG